MTEEHKLMWEIRAALSPYCVVHRTNVGAGRTASGTYLTTGVPKGYSDLNGHRKSDGRAFYIEVKTESGRVSKEQKHFLDQMRKTNAIAGVCRSVEDALKLIKEEN